MHMMKNRGRAAPLMLGLLALLVFAAPSVWAQSVPNTELGSAIFDTISKQLETSTSRIRDAAPAIFIGLATIELVWTAALWSFGEESVGRVMSSLFRKLLLLGFTAAAISMNLPAQITGGIQQIASGGQQLSTPGEIFKKGIETSGNLMSSASHVIGKLQKADVPEPTTAAEADQSYTGAAVAMAGSVFSKLSSLGTTLGNMVITIVMGAIIMFAALIASAAMLWAFAMAAMELFITQIEVTVVSALGLFFLAGGASRWTTTYAEKTWAYAVSVGVKLGVLSLLIQVVLDGLAQASIGMIIWADNIQMLPASRSGVDMTTWAGVMDAGKSVAFGYAVLVIAAMLCSQILSRVPSMVSAAFNGSPSMGGGDAVSSMAGTASTGLAGASNVASAAGALSSGVGAAAAPAAGKLMGAMSGAAAFVAPGAAAMVSTLAGAAKGAMGGGGSGGGASGESAPAVPSMAKSAPAAPATSGLQGGAGVLSAATNAATGGGTAGAAGGTPGGSTGAAAGNAGPGAQHVNPLTTMAKGMGTAAKHHDSGAVSGSVAPSLPKHED